MKKIILSVTSIFMLLSMCFFAVGAASDKKTYSTDDYTYSIQKDGTVEIGKYIGTAEKVSIPSKIDGKKVTSIGRAAFYYNKNVKEVTIPGTVKTIGISAFKTMESLEKVTIKNGVKTIKDGAFAECDKLKSITLPNSVTTLGDDIFFECDLLEKIIVGNNITKIGHGIVYLTKYYGNKSNWSDDGVLYLGNYAIDSDDIYRIETGGKIIIRKGTVTVADNALSSFYSTTKITSIVLPDSLKYIGSYAFSHKYYLKSVTFGKNIKSIGEYAFYDCPKLKKVSLPSSVEKIDKCAFGYLIKDNNAEKKMKNKEFAISGYPGTAEKYASKNGFDYTYKKPAATSKITAKKTSATITLSWNKVSEADGYRIYQYNAKSKKYEKIKTTTAVSYKILNLKSATTYKFKIRSYYKLSDGTTVWGSLSDAISVTTKPSKVIVNGISAGNNSFTLNWETVAGASGYQIVYCVNKDFKTSKKITVSGKTSIKKTIKKLEDQKTYYVKVRAYKTVDGKKVYGDYSKVVSVKVK